MNKLKSLIMAGCLAAPALLMAQPQVLGVDAENYLERGKQMFERGNYVGAIDQLNMATRFDAPDYQIEEAEFYIALSQFERGEKRSLDALEEFIESHPASRFAEEAKNQIGLFYFYRGEYDQALEAFRKVRENALDDDANEDLIYRKAFCELQMGRFGTAERMYGRLASTKRYADASLFYKGYINYVNKDYDDAWDKFTRINRTTELGYQAQYYMTQIEFLNEHYNNVIALGTSLIEDHSNEYFEAELNRLVGESYYHKHDYANAREYLNYYLEQTEDNIVRSAAYALGVMDFDEGYYENSVKNMKPVTETEDALAQSAYYYMGQAELKRDNLQSATIDFERAALMEAGTDEVREAALYNYAVCTGRGAKTPFNKSIEMFEQFLNQYPNSQYADAVEQHLIDTYLNGNDYEKALESINRINNPSEKVLKAKQVVLYNLGTQSLKNDKTADAKRYLKQAIEQGNLDNTVANESRLWLAEAQYRDGETEQAIENQKAYINAAEKTDPNYGLAQYNLGYSLYRQKKYAEARKAFQNAIDSKTLSRDLKADAYNRVGDTHYYAQNYSAAEQSYESAIDGRSNESDYSMYQKALMAGLNGRQQSKVDQLDAMLKAYPKSTYAPQAMIEKANALTELGSNTAAIETLNSLLKKYPESVEARKGLLQQAILYKSVDEIDNATAAYKRVISTYPTSTEAETAAEDLKLIYAERGQLQDFADYLEGIPNGPRLDVSEMDRLTFEAAEKDAIVDNPSIDKMVEYLNNNPNGAYAAKAQYYIGRYYFQKKNYNDALESLDEALKAGDDASFAEDALAMKSEILAIQGNADDAIETFKRLADKASSDDARIIAQLGIMRTAAQEGEWDEVIEATDALLNAGALSAEEEKEVTLNRALANAFKGNDEAATDDLKVLAQDVQNVYGAQAAYELAHMQYDASDYKNCEKTLNRIIDEGTPHNYWLGKSFILLSDLYYTQGKKNDAIEILESLKTNYPDDEQDIFNAIEVRLNKWNPASPKAKPTKSGSKHSADNKAK